MDTVIKQYSLMMETMEEVNNTTHDGLKAGGILSSIEKFETLFGLRLKKLYQLWLLPGLSTSIKDVMRLLIGSLIAQLH